MLTKFEFKYMLVGLAYIIINGPLQIALFWYLLVAIDMDLITVSPGGMLLAWLIFAVSVNAGITLLIMSIHDARKMINTLHVTKIPLFALHAGTLMIMRILVIIIIRAFVTKDWRKGENSWDQ